jgi:hypothetical protein
MAAKRSAPSADANVPRVNPLAGVQDPPSRRLTFTDPFLRGLKAGAVARDYRDRQQPGLLARVLPSGLVQFSVRYRFQGRQRRLMLGEYSAVGLADAAKKGLRALGAN